MAASDAARLTRRGRLQLIFAAISAVLTVLAAIIPAWIEKFTTLEPDGASGELEWLLAVLSAA